MQILFLVCNIQTLRAYLVRGFMGDKMDSVASSTKWTVLPIAPDEFQEVEVPPFS